MSHVPRVILKDYDPSWPGKFQTEAASIRQSLGAFLDKPNQDIQHIGSTAIKDMPAKDTIDILVGVKAVADLDTCADKLVTDLGYTRLPGRETRADRRYFYKQEKTSWRFALHLIVRNDPLWNRFTIFRDALSSNPGNNLLPGIYARLKRRYADDFGNDVVAYTRAKDAFIVAVISP